ncbi:MAG: 7-carboxy-7-deazaguanine synthase [Candidatus Sumerlaeia bacterium]|nr:7-carboxy-7-deazaguanine synthase [Candidatus Sumerlaeia bacterium]
MSYHVKTIYKTIQGEGAQTGQVAVFLRFSGCNLWSGRPEDRERAVCRFCDTDFLGTDGPGGGVYTSPEDLAAAVNSVWRGGDPGKWVVCTGGEPLLQLDAGLVEAFHDAGFKVAVETNGTRKAPPGLDWICVSPKAGANLALKGGDELKLVYPQIGLEPRDFAHLAFDHFFLQPMDGRDREHNTLLAIAYIMEHPRWRLSVQTHKVLGLD